MNWKKLTIGITIVNLLGYVLIEFWSKHYAQTNISGAAATLIAIHILGYYILVIGSRAPSEQPSSKKIEPHNCPGHQWHKHKYSIHQEQCIVCGAERGT